MCRFILALILIKCSLWSIETFDSINSLDARLTFITTTSIVPGHPSTKLLERSLHSWSTQPGFLDMPKIIVFDGPPSGRLHQRHNEEMTVQEAYNEYKRRCKELVLHHPVFKNTMLIFLAEHRQLTGVLTAAMQFVQTKYIFVHQHDFILLESLELEALMDSMDADPVIQYVHFRRTKNLVQNTEPVVEPYLGPKVPLCVSYNWSDNEHLATKKHYEQFVLVRCANRVIPMEHELAKPIRQHCIHHPEDHRKFGIFSYGGYGEGPFVRHIDGRNWGRQ